MAGRLVEFASDCTKMTFVPSLWKEVAAKQAILFTEGNLNAGIQIPAKKQYPMSIWELAILEECLDTNLIESFVISFDSLALCKLMHQVR